MQQVSETYDKFCERMRSEGWRIQKFKCFDPVAVARALHRWYDPLYHVLSPEHYPGYENEFWFKER